MLATQCFIPQSLPRNTLWGAGPLPQGLVCSQLRHRRSGHLARTHMQAVAAATEAASLDAPHGIETGEQKSHLRVNVSQQGPIAPSAPQFPPSSQNAALHPGHVIDQSDEESCPVRHDELNVGQTIGEGAASYATHSVPGVSAGVQLDPYPVQGTGALHGAPAQKQGASHRHEMPARSVHTFPAGALRLTGVTGFDLSQHDAELKQMLACERVCALLPVISHLPLGWDLLRAFS